MKRLGDAELEIMLAVWAAGEPVQSTYVQEKLRGGRDWALPAVITALNRLVDKGYLACEKRGRGNLYRALIGEEEYKAAEGRGILDRLYGGSFTGMVASLCNGKAIGKDDLAELRRIKLRNEISGKRGIVVIHHPNREFGRHPVLQQSQVEDAAERHHHHRTDQIYGTAPPYSQFTPYYSDYTFHTAMNYLTTIALIPGSRPSTAESGTALTSNVFASYMSVSLVAFHVAYESRTAI